MGFLAAFLVGIAAGNIIDVPLLPALAIGGVAGLLTILLRRQAVSLLLALIIAGTALGLARMEYDERHSQPAHPLSRYNDHEARVTLTGTVVEDPDRRVDHTKLTLEVERWSDGVVEKYVDGKVLVKTARLPAYAYGDELQLTGALRTPFESEEFSYKNYLARYGVESVLYYPRITQLSEGNGNPFFATLFRLRAAFEGEIGRIFPEPSASFMAGLLTGSRRGIPEDVMEDFNATGLTHIIAISGYNIALIIALAVALVGRFIRRQWQFPFVAIFVVLFTLFVGAGPAVVRAAVMGLLAFFALTIGRQYHAGVAIAATGAGMVALTPEILLDDVSFQLSFAAVLGLMYIAPLFESITQRIPNILAIRESLVLTISSNIATAPLILYHFERLPLIAPVANLLVAPAIPLAMATGFVATVVGWVSEPLGIALGFVPHLLLSYILVVAHLLA